MNRRGDSRPISLIISFFVVVILVIAVMAWMNIKFGSEPADSVKTFKASVAFDELFSVFLNELFVNSEKSRLGDSRDVTSRLGIPSQRDIFCSVISDYGSINDAGLLSGEFGDDEVLVCISSCSESIDSGSKVIFCSGQLKYGSSSRFADIGHVVQIVDEVDIGNGVVLRVLFGVFPK